MFIWIAKWLREERAMAAVETALVLPLLVTMLLGTIDLGRGILINKKVIAASQTISDLIGREQVVDTAFIDDVIIAAELTLAPYSPDNLGVDIVGVEFNEDTGAPEEDWRETRNMMENANILADAEGLGAPGEGVLGVTVVYTYVPLFSGVVIPGFDMQEVSFVRGRRNPFVDRVN